MNITQIENTVSKLLTKVDKNTFIYNLLLAYGKPKSTIKRLETGALNMSKTEGEVSWKKEVFFKTFEGQLIGAEDLEEVLAEAIKTIKHNQRFVIVTDYKRFLAFDTKTIDRLDIEFKDLSKNYAFFLPWAGMEKAQHLSENPADVKAAERMAKLFDELKKDNPEDSPEAIHSLNVFLSRLLFCFFAEDTSIFEDNLFTNSIDSHTQKDGSDVHSYLKKLFDVLNLPENPEREQLPEHLKKFPYVNGGLFSENIQCPKFSKRSRQILIDSGELDWKGINPDIFGSMFQAVIAVDQRGTLGQHYTSVPNIMKVIQPLFLNELYEAYEEAKGNDKKISALLTRITKIKFLDPACGSGNFLIIAYKELRKLEMKIFKETGQMALSGITLSQFYGIEIDDFAHEIAILALWLAEHQMNVEFFKEFGRTSPTLPLRTAGNIEQGNACRLDWEQVCPKEKDDETYILGNPPYLGFSQQDKAQKEDIKLVWGNTLKTDYISCWFLKGAKYGCTGYAFVSTNSICQGEQVASIWPTIFNHGVKINFCHTSFLWQNSAKSNAGVYCVIIGLIEKNQKKPALIFTGDVIKSVKNIGPYLIQDSDFIVSKRTKPLSELPQMKLGDMAKDGGGLFLSTEEKNDVIKQHPDSKNLIKPLVGSLEFLRGLEKWAIWVEDSKYKEAQEIPFFANRFSMVKESRLASSKKATQEFANKPYKFVEIRYENVPKILIPTVSSSRREYIPLGFFDDNTIINAPNNVINNPKLSIFGILHSKIHISWVKAIGGKLKTDYRYSTMLCYNTFPFPKISKEKEIEIETSVKDILRARANHSEMTLAQMYDPDKMPKDLRVAHDKNDLLIDKCYREQPFLHDEERLEYLFKLYEKMIAKEQQLLNKSKKKKA